jgi:hypothetical protein
MIARSIALLGTLTLFCGTGGYADEHFSLQDCETVISSRASGIYPEVFKNKTPPYLKERSSWLSEGEFGKVEFTPVTDVDPSTSLRLREKIIDIITRAQSEKNIEKEKSAVSFLAKVSASVLEEPKSTIDHWYERLREGWFDRHHFAFAKISKESARGYKFDNEDALVRRNIDQLEVSKKPLAVLGVDITLLTEIEASFSLQYDPGAMTIGEFRLFILRCAKGNITYLSGDIANQYGYSKPYSSSGLALQLLMWLELRKLGLISTKDFFDVYFDSLRSVAVLASNDQSDEYPPQYFDLKREIEYSLPALLRSLEGALKMRSLSSANADREPETTRYIFEATIDLYKIVYDNFSKNNLNELLEIITGRLPMEEEDYQLTSTDISTARRRIVGE